MVTALLVCAVVGLFLLGCSGLNSVLGGKDVESRAVALLILLFAAAGLGGVLAVLIRGY